MEPSSEISAGSSSNNKNNSTCLPKLKVLAFHGYRQNGSSFKGKIGSFRKTVAKYVDMTFITGPHAVKPEEGEENNDDQRGWWFNAEDHSFSGKRVGGPAIGFTNTLELIEKVFKEHGPFHGLLGFSQGACLVGMLSAMQQKGLLPYSFDFAIMASGFCSGSLVHKSFYDADITLPTLHIYGDTDKVIPKEMSEALVNIFVKPLVVEHRGGHYLACSGSLKSKYKDFFGDMVDEFLEQPNENDDDDNQPPSTN